MLGGSFHGASGAVQYGKQTENGRNFEGIAVGLFNIRPQPVNPETGKRSFGSVMTSIWRDPTGWVDIEGTAVVYRDGSTKAPELVRKVYEENFLTSGVRVFGLVLMALGWLLAIVSIALLGWLRNDPIVQRAQPFFMQLMCVGSFIMNAAIFTVSFDEGAGWTDRQLDLQCTLTPWFFFVGQTMTFCSLFTKLYRLDKVLSFRRTAVTVLSVIGPLVALLVITISILIAWTIVDPWMWERVLINEIPAETYGKCTSENVWAFFGPLMGVMLFAELLTMLFAWKTADVPEDFRDSSAVMYACFAQIQSWAVGVAMLAVIGTASADGTYLGRVFVIWVFAVSSVAVVVGPKLYKAIRIRRNPELGQKKGRVKVTGVYTNNSQPTVGGGGNSANAEIFWVV